MEKTINFIGISGSLRRQSRNTGLLRYAAQVVPVNVHFEIASINDLPFYNADIQTKPESVQKLIAQAGRADAIVFGCAEYNYSLAPALKNALDWLSRESGNSLLSGKPAAIMGAGGGMGTSRSQYHLRQVCVYLNLHPLNAPEIFYNAFSDSFDEDGNLLDPRLQDLIRQQMVALAESCRNS